MLYENWLSWVSKLEMVLTVNELEKPNAIMYEADERHARLIIREVG